MSDTPSIRSVVITKVSVHDDLILKFKHSLNGWLHWWCKCC